MAVIRAGFNNPQKQPEKPLNEMTDKEKTEKIYECLDRLHHEHWSLKNFITIREARCGTGYRYQNQRSFDYRAISTLEGNQKKEELPPWAGLLEMAQYNGKYCLCQIVGAPYKPISRPLGVLLLNASAIRLSRIPANFKKKTKNLPKKCIN